MVWTQHVLSWLLNVLMFLGWKEVEVYIIKWASFSTWVCVFTVKKPIEISALDLRRGIQIFIGLDHGYYKELVD